jgi:hypothetical protein
MKTFYSVLDIFMATKNNTALHKFHKNTSKPPSKLPCPPFYFQEIFESNHPLEWSGDYIKPRLFL